MGLSITSAIALAGVDGTRIEVQCDISAGLPGLSFTGLADTSVVESRERVRSAVVNSGAVWPNRRVTVALFPADVSKSGSRFDLAVTMAVLSAANTVPGKAVEGVAWIAELGLDGTLRPVRGVLPAVLAARRTGVERVVVSTGNAAEAALVSGVEVRMASTLRQVLAALTGQGPPLPQARAAASACAEPAALPDIAEVSGQPTAKWALEIAAAGGHHLMMVGAPGAGKTMLAERLPGLLPRLDDQDSLEVTALHSVAGLLNDRPRLVRRPPWQAPHHTASVASLVGGGSHLARPGAISLAHRGVLFLDESPEFSVRALDALRQPLESGTVTLSRGGGTVVYPARFQLVLAANPCPCAKPADQCVCTAMVRRRYEQRLSGPLMDRIDLQLQIAPVSRADLYDPQGQVDTSAAVAARVLVARQRAAVRWRGTPWRLNAEIPGPVLRSTPWLPPAAVLRGAEHALETGSLSARGFDRVLRLAWTIADLDAVPAPRAEHVREALQLRTGDVTGAAA